MSYGFVKTKCCGISSEIVVLSKSVTITLTMLHFGERRGMEWFSVDCSPILLCLHDNSIVDAH